MYVSWTLKTIAAQTRTINITYLIEVSVVVKEELSSKGRREEFVDANNPFFLPLIYRGRKMPISKDTTPINIIVNAFACRETVFHEDHPIIAISVAKVNISGIITPGESSSYLDTRKASTDIPSRHTAKIMYKNNCNSF